MLLFVRNKSTFSHIQELTAHLGKAIDRCVTAFQAPGPGTLQHQTLNSVAHTTPDDPIVPKSRKVLYCKDFYTATYFFIIFFGLVTKAFFGFGKNPRQHRLSARFDVVAQNLRGSKCKS